MQAVDTDIFFKFRLIADGEDLPSNIALVHAADLETALTEMFTRAVGEKDVNFIVWNPPVPVLDDAEQQKLAEHRLHLPFSIRGRVYPHMPLPESRVSSICRLQNVDGPDDDSVPYRAVKSLVLPRVRDIFQMAGNIVERHQIPIRPRNYEINAHDTEAPYKRPFHVRTFHVDAEREPFLRLLFPSLGAGTYVADAADIAYQIKHTGVRAGTVVNPNAIIWMMHTRSFALMKSGGSMPEDADPAVHCVPFGRTHYNSAVDRVLERYDFNFK
jgi:hypothetical protein